MITFKAIVISGNRRKDGTYVVNIRVTFKGKCRRLATTIIAQPSDLTRTLRIKSGDILNKTDEIIGRMRAAASELSMFDLEHRDVDWVVGQIKDKISGERFRLDFFEFAQKYIMTKTPSTRCAYSCALNTFERFLGRREIDINDITRSMLQDFMEFVDNEPKMHADPKTGRYLPTNKVKVPLGASSRHVSKLGHIFEQAKNRYNDEDSDRIVIPKSPFRNIAKVIPAPNGQKNLGVELMQRIISAQADTMTVRTALDVFVVSFGLMGANLADLYMAKPFAGEWRYNRMKTRSRRADKAEMRVTIPEELRPYIERLSEGKSGWWLSRLHEMASGGKDVCTAKVNAGLRKWCERNEVPVFTFYAARHTWATLARRAGVEKATIDDCLCHKGDFAMADIYAEKSWELMREANRKVLDLFEW